MSITINRVEGRSDLYCRYASEVNPQDCYIEIDCEEKTLSASYNPTIGSGIPERVHSGHVRRFPIPCLTAASANALMESLVPLAETIVANYESVWDGNNYVARFAQPAWGAMREIESKCEDWSDGDDQISCVDARDWLQDSIRFIAADGSKCSRDDKYESVELGENTITAETEDSALKTGAEQYENEAELDNTMVNCYDYLIELRDKCKEHKADRLSSAA